EVRLGRGLLGGGVPKGTRASDARTYGGGAETDANRGGSPGGRGQQPRDRPVGQQGEAERRVDERSHRACARRGVPNLGAAQRERFRPMMTPPSRRVPVGRPRVNSRTVP